MEYTKIAAAGVKTKIGQLGTDATLAITDEGRVVLYSADEVGNVTGEFFNLRGPEVSASGNQQYLVFRTPGGNYTVDFSINSRTSLRVGGMGANLVAAGRELHRLDMLGWVTSLKAVGVRVRYLRMRTIIWSSLAFFFFVLLPIAVWVAAARTGSNR